MHTHVTLRCNFEEPLKTRHNVIVYSRLEVGVMQYLYFSMLTKLNTIKYKSYIEIYVFYF